MDILLTLTKVAVVTKDNKLKEQLRKVFNYIDKKGCRITTEIEDNHIYVYDVTNSEYLLSIKVNLVDTDVKERNSAL